MKSSGLGRRITILILLLTTEGLYSVENGSDTDQTYSYRDTGSIRNMTTSSGYPVPISDTVILDPKRTKSYLILNDFFMESMSHLAGERIPERVVHGKGAGAFGTFKVTHDLSDKSKADLFSTVGKVTPVVARFSITNQRLGASDVARDTRGFAVKFYTKEGNYDFVGNDVEVFLVKDPIKFPTFAHSFQANPRTQVSDVNSMWDFITLQPESLHMFMRIFGDRGIPDGYRYMPAYGIHTFELINHNRTRTYARFHLLPDLGVRNLTNARAESIQANDLNYAIKDLYNAIDNGIFPTWTLYVQTIAENEVSESKINIFDVTKVWPVRRYPLRPIGVLELNRNPKNYFADIEQLAFNPGNFVPGIRGSGDPLLEARILTYRMAHIHRLGVNFNKIRVNCPFRADPRTYNRDGVPPVGDNEPYAPNYYPNSFHGPQPYDSNDPPRKLVFIDPGADNFDQAGEIYNQMSEEERSRLVENFVESLSSAKSFLQKRAVKHFYLIHEELGSRIEGGLNGKTSK